jgi:aflatoxin B1 aldehyde reductase
METKLSPRAKIGLPEGVQTTHCPEHVRLGLEASLKALKTDKVEMFYLHAPGILIISCALALS